MMNRLKIFAGTVLSLAVATGANPPAFAQSPEDLSGSTIPQVQSTVALAPAEVVEIRRSTLAPNDLLITVQAVDRYQTFVAQSLTPALTLGQPVYVGSGLVFLDEMGHTPPVAYDPGVTGVAARYGAANRTVGKIAVGPGQEAYGQPLPNPGLIEEPSGERMGEIEPLDQQEQPRVFEGREEPFEQSQEPFEEEPFEQQQEPFEEEEPFEQQQEPFEEEEPVRGLW